MLKVFGDFYCKGHRGGFGSLQRLVERFTPVEWVSCEEDADVALFFDDGVLQPERLRRCRVPVVLYLSSTYVPAFSSPYADAFNANTRELAEHADSLCYTSAMLRQYLIDHVVPRVAELPGMVLPPMYDPAIFYPSPEAERVRQQPLTVIAVALWRDWFRWLTVFEAFAILLRRHPDARLIVAGGWVSDEVLTLQNEVARELGIDRNIRFRDASAADFEAEDRAIADAYRSAHVFVHTRWADWGTFTCVEALACGLPVACGDYGGLAEFARECAYVSPYAADPQSVVLPILNPYEVADQLTAAGLAFRQGRCGSCIEIARQYEAPAVGENLASFLQSAADRRNRNMTCV